MTADALLYPPLVWILVGLTGLIFGSFATLVSHRLVHGGSIIAGRSRCPHCQTPLGVRDLAPLFSWLASKGTCRYCKAGIHWRYPLIESATALLFLLVVWQAGLTLSAATLCLFALCIVIMTAVDFEHHIIPDETQIAMAALGGVFHLAVIGTPVATPLAGLLVGLFSGWALQKGYKALRKRDGLGTGDVKFLAVAGIWLGPAGLVPLMFLGGLLGIVTALIWRLAGRGERFPFGPALGTATLVLVLFPGAEETFWELHRHLSFAG